MALVSSGERIGDALVVDRLLGEGAFAEVHRVEHRYLGWQAMKVFKQVASERETRALLGEARLLSTLGHRHIIRLFDVGMLPIASGQRGYFTMEYVPGGTLERFAAAHRPAVPTDVVAEVTAQIAEGLAVAHDQVPPVLHRDLTPANVLIGYDGTGLRIRISDFGLARHADPFTRLASAQGTYAFMAPEVLRGGGYSCAADVWSVGVLAYLMLTDHLPFDDGRPFSPHRRTRFSRPLLPPSSYNETVDRELDRIVVAALDLDPGARTATARDLAAALATRTRAQPETGAPAARPTTAPHAAGPTTAPHAVGPTTGTTAAGPTTAPRAAESSAAAVTRPPSARARALADEAHETAGRPGGLARAADLLEEAIGLSPRLAEQHAHTLILWRRGVVA